MSLENSHLKDVLPKQYKRIPKDILISLLKTFSEIEMAENNGDTFGAIYEYFLEKFASSEGQEGGEFFTPTSLVRLIRVAMAEGYASIKVDPIIFSNQPDGKGNWKITGPLGHKVNKTVYDRVAAMRKAGGDDLYIIIENHSNTDTIAAIQIGKSLDDLRIFYYEEPAHPLNPGNMLEVRSNVNIPIASGERIYTRYGYREFFENRSIQVIQPDICLCGGITEAKKICDMSLTYDCKVQIHVCGSPISKPVALQIEAAIPNFIIHKHHQRALNPDSRATCVYDHQPVNGIYKVPDIPGIGNELMHAGLCWSAMAANLAGAVLTGLMIRYTGIFDDSAATTFLHAVVVKKMSTGFIHVLIK